MRKLLYVSLVGLAAASCVSVVPSYDETLYTHIAAVNDNLDRINAAVSKVYYPAPPFSKVEAYYVDAVANLDAAIAISQGRATYLQGQVSGRPAALISNALMACQKALDDQLRAHRKEPLNMQTLEAIDAKVVCSIPRIMESRLKKEA